METTKPDTQTPEAKVFVSIYSELHTLNFNDATKVEGATMRAIARFTREINMPLEYCKAHIQQDDYGTFKIVIEAKTEGKKAFPDYKQEYSWADAVHHVGDQLFTKWKLKSYLLLHSSSAYSGAFTNHISFSLRKTIGSDISGTNIFL